MEVRQKLLKVAGIPIGEIEIVQTEGGYYYGNTKFWPSIQGNLKAQFESEAGEELTGEASSEDS